MHTYFLSWLSGQIHSLAGIEVDPIQEIRRYVQHPFGVFTNLFQMQVRVYPDYTL